MTATHLPSIAFDLTWLFAFQKHEVCQCLPTLLSRHFLGFTAVKSCSCLISVPTALAPSSPNTLRLCLIDICGVAKDTTPSMDVSEWVKECRCPYDLGLRLRRLHICRCEHHTLHLFHRIHRRGALLQFLLLHHHPHSCRLHDSLDYLSTLSSSETSSLAWGPDSDSDSASPWFGLDSLLSSS